MLHDILSQYLGDIEDSIRRLESANVEHYEDKVEDSDEPLIFNVIKEAKLLAQ